MDIHVSSKILEHYNRSLTLETKTFCRSNSNHVNSLGGFQSVTYHRIKTDVDTLF